MGCDVHIVLGRINLQAIAARPTVESSSTALVLFGQGNIEAEDFSFEEVPDEFDLDRNYQLFSWLANVRGDLRPYYEGNQRKGKTREFLEWLDRKLIEEIRKKNPTTNSRWGNSDASLFEKYYFGDHSFIIHGVKQPLEFNYDEVVQLCDYDSEKHPDFDWSKLNYNYYRNPEGKTYREMFGEQYFKFLDYCQRNSWHFIVFGFDS